MPRAKQVAPQVPLPKFELCINTKLFNRLSGDVDIKALYPRLNAVYYIVVDDRVPDSLVYIYTESGHFERKFRYE